MSDESKKKEPEVRDDDETQELSGERLEAVAGGSGVTKHFFTVELAEGRIAPPEDEENDKRLKSS